MIREQIRLLVERGDVTAQEYKHVMRWVNREEQNAILEALSFEALDQIVNEALKNARSVVKAFSSVMPIVETWAPELLRRIKQQLSDNERSVLVREMQKEIDELKDRVEYIESTVNALEVIEMLGDNPKKITGQGSMFDRIRKLAGHG